MLRQLWLIIICASLGVLAPHGLAAQEDKLLPPEATHEDYPLPTVPEATKAALIHKLIAGPPAMTWGLSMPPGATAQDRAWCTEFLEDFRAGRDIAFVEPVARSERYGDRVFEPWRRRCPRLAMNISQATYYTMLYDRYPNLPHWMPDGSLLPGYQYGTRNFKLYTVDIDNNAANGEEVIFYSERAYSYWELIMKDDRLPFALPPVDRDWNTVVGPERIPSTLRIFDGAYFRTIDQNTCASGIVYMADGPYDFIEGRPLENYNGIIAYRGKNYFFSLDQDVLPRSRDAPSPYALHLATVQIAKYGVEVKRTSLCGFRSQ